MSVSFVADVHVHNHRKFGGASVGGINTRCQEILDALELACRKAADSKSDAFIVLGDLFDTTKPTPQVIASVMSRLESGHPNTLLLVGNHDQVSTYSGDHAMAPLAALPNVTVVEKPTCFIEDTDTPLAVIPFRPGSAKEWLPKDLSSLGDIRGYTVCVHLGIMDGYTPHYLENAHDAIHVDLLRKLQKTYGFRNVIAGNWHHHDLWEFDELTIVQTGALVPTGFDNPGLGGYGSVGHIKGTKFRREVVPGPRYVKAKTLEDIEDLKKDMPEGEHPIRLRWAVQPEELSSSLKTAEALRNDFSSVEVSVDAKSAQIAVRSAAIAARSADTLEEALAAFVDRMDLPDGVVPGDVVQLAKDYLGGK